MAKTIKSNENENKTEFKEQIHKCDRYIFISIMINGEVKIYKISFNKDYLNDIDYYNISDSKLVDFTHCPYCGKSLIEYE